MSDYNYPVSQQPSGTPKIPASSTYVIQIGDSLSGISKKTGVSEAELMRLNGIKNKNRIVAGATLRLPASSSASATPRGAATSGAIPLVASQPQEPKGDSVEFSSNGLGKPAITPTGAPAAQAAPATGQPQAQTPVVDQNPPSSVEYRIKKRDNFDKLAEKYGCTVKRIMDLNPGVDPTKLQIGQVVKLPPPLPPLNQSIIPEAVRTGVLRLAQEHAMLHEGFVGTAKECPAGYVTYGYGHKLKPGDKGKHISEADAKALLAKDMQAALQDVRKIFGDEVLSTLTKEQIVVLMNLAFNVGPAALENSDCATHIMNGDFDSAQAEMDFVMANNPETGQKEPLLGLLNRRIDEMLMFGGGKLSPQAEAKVLMRIQQVLGGEYKTLQEAIAALKMERATLAGTSPLSTEQDARLTRLNNATFINSLDSANTRMATRPAKFITVH